MQEHHFLPLFLLWFLLFFYFLRFLLLFVCVCLFLCLEQKLYIVIHIRLCAWVNDKEKITLISGDKTTFLPNYDSY